MQEVGGVGLYSTYDVIATEENIYIDHRDRYHKEGEVAPYEAPPYSVVTKTQRESNHIDEGRGALCSVVAKPQRESVQTDEALYLNPAIAEPQHTPTSTDAVEYSKLHHNH